MNDFIEQLESRTLMSTTFAAAGNYAGTATPHGKGSVAVIIAATGTKKGGGKLAANLTLNIANNDIVTGTLALEYGPAKTPTTLASYALSGLVVGADVNITIESTGKAVGTFDGALKALNRKLTGPFTDTINGQTVTGQFNLINQASVKPPKSGSSSNNGALAPGVIPNQTPPPITPSTGNGDPTGITGGDNSGTGTIDDGGSLLG
jgi:hypothetical protein